MMFVCNPTDFLIFFVGGFPTAVCGFLSLFLFFLISLSFYLSLSRHIPRVRVAPPISFFRRTIVTSPFHTDTRYMVYEYSVLLNQFCKGWKIRRCQYPEDPEDVEAAHRGRHPHENPNLISNFYQFFSPVGGRGTIRILHFWQFFLLFPHFPSFPIIFTNIHRHFLIILSKGTTTLCLLPLHVFHVLEIPSSIAYTEIS